MKDPMFKGILDRILKPDPNWSSLYSPLYFLKHPGRVYKLASEGPGSFLGSRCAFVALGFGSCASSQYPEGPVWL